MRALYRGITLVLLVPALVWGLLGIFLEHYLGGAYDVLFGSADSD